MLVALLLFSGLSSVAQAGLIISPLAADLSTSSYTQSSFYISSTAESVFNGGVWNAGTTGYHWIQADMGLIKTLTQLKITIAQAPNGSTSHDVYLSNSLIGNNYSSLTPIFSHSGSTINGQLLDILFATPQSGRYLQIVSYGGPTSWTALGDINGRINWIQPAINSSGQGSQNVPEPSTIAIFALGIVGLASRRLKKQS